MKKSPWAKFKMPSTPKSRARPAAMSAIEAPTTRPLSAATTTCSISVRAQVGGDQVVRGLEFRHLMAFAEPALSHHIEAAADSLQEVEGGIDDEHANARRHRLAECLRHEVDVARHQTFAGLVHQDQLRLESEAASQRKRLLLAAAQRSRRLAPALDEEWEEGKGRLQAASGVGDVHHRRGAQV